MRKTALITGITGQDGSYLSELLLSKGYEVHGIVRRSSTFSTSRIDHLFGNPMLLRHYGDLTDGTGLMAVVKAVMPDEIYNLGAQSHVRVSFDQPAYTVDTAALGALRMLECAREVMKEKPVRFYQASSSEMFGSSPPPQDETTPFHPRSPYACAKAYAHQQVVNYREAYGLFGCNGILHNHESPRRPENFVTRKITRTAARIKLGLEKELVLGNLDSKRDWGFARDYVEAMWLMLQQEKPDDYVIATGETHSVREFLEHAFRRVDLDWKQYVKTDERYMRPAEVNILCGNPAKAMRILGWSPRVKFEELVGMMVDADLKLTEAELRAKGVSTG